MAADQMQTTQEKIVQYVGVKYGEDIANELQNKTTVVILTPTYSSMTMTCHVLQIALVRGQQAMMSTTWQNTRTLLEAEIIGDPSNHTLVTKLAKLNNDIAQADFDVVQDVPI